MVKLNPFSKEEVSISSLNEGRNMMFFAFMLVAPFYVVVGAAFIVDLLGLGTEYTLITLIMGMAGWASLTTLHWSNLKSALAELKLFGAIVRFSQTVAYQLDMLFDEDRIGYVGATSKGRDIYLVPFTEDYGYNHPAEGPITFNKAYIILPFSRIPWKETFGFKNKTQVWFRGLALTCSNSEMVVFDVPQNWDWVEGEWIPTFVVADCWARGVRSQARMQKLEPQELEYEVIEDGKPVTKKIEIEKIDDPIIGNEIIESKMITFKGLLSAERLAKARVVTSRDKLLDDRRNVATEYQKIRDADQAVDRDFFTEDTSSKWKAFPFKYFAYVAIALIAFVTIIYLFG